jgi:ribosomal protein S12 methylthiotransferase
MQVYIENLGCAKNQVDAEVMLQRLEEAGWSWTSDPAAADLIIVNSCGFIAPAKEESLETVMALRSSYPEARILFAGCLAERYGGELAGGVPEADGFFGNRDLSRVTEAAEKAAAGERAVVKPKEHRLVRGRSRLFSHPGAAYVKLSEGCNHRCSYCAIPLIRGDLRSYPFDEVMEEIRSLLRRGIFEINLIGQDLAAFGTDRGRSEFPELLRRISETEGDFWVRLLYIHPDNFPVDILPVMQRDPRILPYFDIPFQHASARILRKMGRTGGRESYLRLLSEIRSALPDAVLRTTFMTGFPGERRSDFEELLRFQREAAFDWAGVFVFSREEGTAAAEMRGVLGDRLAHRSAEDRKRRLEKEQQRITEERMERFTGRQLRVMVEERIEQEPLALGRAYLHAPEVDGAAVLRAGELVPGTTVECRVMRRNGIDMEVEPLYE